jgi:hypothetical protein
MVLQRLQRRRQQSNQIYDSDSFQIAIDNCATSCFTNSMEDFIGTPRKTNTRITGIGTATSTYVGTVEWLIVDNSGRRHVLRIPNTRYQAGLPFRLLCPQHVAQAAKDPQTTCLTLMDKVIFVWGGGKWKRTLPLHKSTNVGIMWSAPSNHKFYAFAAQVDPHLILDDEEEENQATRRTMVSGREEDNDDNVQQVLHLPIASEGQRESSVTPTSEIPREQPVQIEFMDEEIREPVDEPRDVTSKQAALRKCHNRLNHMSFARIQAMAKHGLLPKYLADVEPPMCACCAFGKATCCPWKNKGEQSKRRLAMVTTPGGCVSVDQLESPTPGFVGQIKGWLTTKRYRAATVFVDHFSGLTFIYCQFSTNAEETVNAKKAFEAYAALQGVSIRHYHADNGRFAETKWLEAVDAHRPQQTISFCGVGAHHQNGIAEKKIRDLQENARTMMLHASLRWRRAHTVSLWPYALRMAVDVMNSTPWDHGLKKSPIKIFASVACGQNFKIFMRLDVPSMS